jgi:hypothetical protein
LRTYILICQLVGQAYPLRLMFDGLSIDNRYLELFKDTSMNCIALFAESVSRVALVHFSPSGYTYKVLHCAFRRTEHNRGRIVRHFSLGFCVDTNEPEFVPPTNRAIC